MCVCVMGACFSTYKIAEYYAECPHARELAHGLGEEKWSMCGEEGSSWPSADERGGQNDYYFKKCRPADVHMMTMTDGGACKKISI